MTKTVTPKQSRANKLQRVHLKQDAEQMLERLRYVSEALTFFGHTYMRRVVLDAQVLIRLMMNEL